MLSNLNENGAGEEQEEEERRAISGAKRRDAREGILSNSSLSTSEFLHCLSSSLLHSVSLRSWAGCRGHVVSGDRHCLSSLTTRVTLTPKRIQLFFAKIRQ